MNARGTPQTLSRDMNPAWWVERWAALAPSRRALVCGTQTVTYRELQARVVSAADWLATVDVGEGDRVAVLLRNGPEILEIFLACARVGAIFVPLNFRFASAELAYLLGNAAPKLVVAERELGSVLGGRDLEETGPPVPVYWVGDAPVPGARYPVVGDRDGGEGGAGRKARGEWLSPESPHVVMYTSGTTGRPKGALLPYRKTFFNALNAREFFDLNPGDVMLVVLPLFHSGGLLIQACPTLYRGATLLLHRRFDPEAVWEDLERQRVTQFLGVPTVYRSLLGARGRRRPARLRASGIGGESAPTGLVRECLEAGFPLRALMGQTETSIFLWASAEELTRKPGTVGRPVFHAEVRLVDRGGKPLESGGVGELQVRGPILMTGYWNDPQETSRIMGGGWLRTGDQARTDEEGYFFLADRARDVYISGGENVYPAEVERVLCEHPGVAEAAVVAVPDDRWGQAGHAYVVRREGASVDAEALTAHCNGRLARYKWPRGVTFVDELPKTALGKVRKQELKGRGE